MSEELGQLSYRLVGCKGWRWRAGMLTACGIRVIEGDSDYIIGHRSGSTDRGGGWIDTVDVKGFLPDLTDPATLGCLLYLVREAWGDPGFYAAQSNMKIKGTDIFAWDTFGYLHGRSCKGMLYRSEAEALVSALESAS